MIFKKFLCIPPLTELASCQIAMPVPAIFKKLFVHAFCPVPASHHIAASGPTLPTSFKILFNTIFVKLQPKMTVGHPGKAFSPERSRTG